jgi:excisionase family DNA binding protein
MATPYRSHGPIPTTAGRVTASSTAADAAVLYTPEEAARRLRVRASWLRRKAAAREVPCTFLGKHLRFSAADLAAIVAACARPAGGRRGRRRLTTTGRDRDLPPGAPTSVHAPDRDDHVRDGSS